MQLRSMPQGRPVISARPGLRQPSAVLVTRDVHEYAIAAATCRQIAAQRKLSSCHPVHSAGGTHSKLDCQLARYQAQSLPFSAIAAADDLPRRSAAVRESFFPADVSPVLAAAESTPGQLASAVFVAVTEGRPLQYASRSGAITPLGGRFPPAAGPGDDWVLSRAGSWLAVPAAVYAAATGKGFAILEDGQSFGTALRQHRLGTAILVDEYRAFSKPLLSELVMTRTHPAPEGVAPGIMTAFSAMQLSRLVWRSLAHREFRAAGGRFAEPAGPGVISLRESETLEYYILSGHGDELHIDHADDEIICGSVALDAVAGGASFGCEPHCPYPGSVRGTDVPVCTMILLSCDSATFGDGFAPPGYSVLLNLLDGWCTSAIAPYKHAMLGPELRLFAEALVKTGYSLGEITDRLNTVTGVDAVADAPFVVVGDPNAVPSPDRRWEPPQTQSIECGDCVIVTCNAKGGRTLDSIVPSKQLEAVGPLGTPLAIEPMSPELIDGDMRFVLRHPPATDGISVVIFGSGNFAEGQLQYRLRRAALPDLREQTVVQNRLSRLSALFAVGAEPGLLARLAQNTAAVLDDLLGYPRVPERLLGHALLEHYDLVRESALGEARLALLRSLVESMAHESLWISHQYSRFYAKVSRLPGQASPGACAGCGLPTTRWRYGGGILGLGPRGPEVCPRCGIVSDSPNPATLQASFSPAPSLAGSETRRRLTVRNVSSVTQRVSVVAQFNEWRELEIEVDPETATMELAPDQTGSCRFRFSFRKPPHDELINLQAFALTEDFQLYCFTQRILVHQQRRSLPTAAKNA
jgi:hypothetical protein